MDYGIMSGQTSSETLELQLALLQDIYKEVKENLEYIVEIEGINIPQVWQDKILSPIDFAISSCRFELTK